MSILGNAVPVDSFLLVLLSLFLIGYFFYKEWPELKRRIKGSDEEVHTVEGRLSRTEKRVGEINDMLSRDYTRLNSIEKLTRANAKAARDSLEERQILMESMLACLKGLHELGANGPTEDGIRNINTYLNRQAHVNQEILNDLEG